MMRSFIFVKMLNCSNNTYMQCRNARSPVISAKWTDEWSVQSLLWYSLLCSEYNQWEQFSLSNFYASSGNLAGGGCKLWSGFYVKINLPIFFFVQNFVQRTSTLWKQRLHFAETTQLWAKIVDNFVRIMFTLCTNVNFVRTTSSFNEQRQLCKNNVHTCPNSAESTMRKREIIDWLAGKHGCA